MGDHSTPFTASPEQIGHTWWVRVKRPDLDVLAGPFPETAAVELAEQINRGAR